MLINRALNRHNEYYTERHHILPRCMGGSDKVGNMVNLTPEEHYVAHQLLIKMYPGNHALVKAAQMMVPNRPSNKLYGWLRRKFADSQSVAQSGSGNTQYGTRWIHHMDLKVSKKIPKTSILPDGWQEGRKIVWVTTEKDCCPVCNTEKSKKRKFCSLSCSAKANNEKRDKKISQEVIERMVEEFISGVSISRCLKNQEFNGTGENFSKFKLELQNRGLV